MITPAYGCPDKSGSRIPPIPTTYNCAGNRDGKSTGADPRGARSLNFRAIASASIRIAVNINIRFCTVREVYPPDAAYPK